MAKIFRASSNPPQRRHGYSAQYIADVVFREPITTAGFILVRVPSGGRTRPHFHEHVDEVMVALTPARIGIGSEVYSLSEGDVAIVDRGQEHWLEAESNTDTLIVAVKIPNISDDKVEH
ncbi:MAG: cupin domain-containing protein [Candidatus Thorarchaeota archaeon]